jgi:hypothetical protein
VVEPLPCLCLNGLLTLARRFQPNSLPLVQRILGGVDVPRLIECNYRAWNGPESGYNMGFHPDDCSGGLLTLEQRQTRVPYGPPDMLSTFTYLTDVDETNPSFAVIPKSRRIDNLQVRLNLRYHSHSHLTY